MIWLVGILLAAALAVVVALVAVWLVGERGHLALPSTRAVIRDRRMGAGPLLRRDGTPSPAHAPKGRVEELRDGLHGYLYGRWPERYIGFLLKHVLPRAKEPLKARVADRYHGKVLPLELAREIIALDHDIPRTDLERIIPYSRAREIVLRAPPEITILDCPCRMNRETPCLPLDVCMVVGRGDFLVEHLPDRARKVTRGEALSILEAEHDRGHVHTAYFKDAMNDRFYAICNCCPCCCGGLEAMMKHGVPMVASSGYVAQSDPELCLACGECVNACPFDAVHLETDRAVVKWAGCMGCGVCESRCSTGAMTLHLDPEKGIPLDVRLLGTVRGSSMPVPPFSTRS